jgi:hypothetical protein
VVDLDLPRGVRVADPEEMIGDQREQRWPIAEFTFCSDVGDRLGQWLSGHGDRLEQAPTTCWQLIEAAVNSQFQRDAGLVVASVWHVPDKLLDQKGAATGLTGDGLYMHDRVAGV